MSEFATCPCCRLPTLNERAQFEICVVCWWEDDGQDDPDADRPNGGPNGEMSLARACQNYADHFDMYEPDARIGVVAAPSPERKMLLSYLQAVRQGERTMDHRRLHGLLRDWSAGEARRTR